MVDLFDTLDAPTAAAEGAYFNDPSGGETIYGITIKVARQNGYFGPMKDMTPAQAKAIRRAIYYARPGIYLIAPISVKIATEVYDSGINLGTGTAVMWLQRCLNALSNGGKLYAKVSVDGAIGPQSAVALSAYLTKRPGGEGTAVMLRALNCLQGADYITLEERNEPLFGPDLYGWLRARVSII